ncbi:MAG: spermidine/putrescine ABC transporter substrate-binding protein [bacterium]|nr:spermidine/putrescine ABC transporter substrate-binding protein [bacterium]
MIQRLSDRSVAESLLNRPLLSRRQFLAGAALACFSFCTSGCSQKQTLNIFNYSNYIGQTTVADFSRDTGIPVIYDEFSDQDTLFAKMKLGAGYDLVVATDYMLRRMIRQKLLAEIKGFALKDQIMDRFADPPWDPNLTFSVPYMWGTTGIGYNKTKVQEPPRRWTDLWNPRYKGRITMLNEKRDSIGAALIALGLNGNTTDPQELAAAKAYLIKQMPLVRQYTCDYIDGLARNEIWLAQAWSGDVARARQSNQDIEYCLPEEGSFVFVDSWAIPATSRHQEEAVAFLNYVMQPQIVSEVTNATGYPNAIKTSLPYVDKQYINAPLGYPPAEMLERTIFQTDIGAEEKKWDRIWNEVKFIAHKEED